MDAAGARGRHAIAAGVAYPHRQIIALVGDGGFTMLMGEMATIAKYQLPVKVIIFKNNSLGQIKWEQIVFEGNPQYGTELYPIDFARFAEACNIPGYTLDHPEQVRPVLRQMLEQPGPALVEAVIDPNEPPMPGNITTKQALHFAKAVAKGQKDRWDIIKTIAEDKIREVL